MTRRTRTLAGFLTLAALTMSFGETVYASLCMSMSDMDMGADQMTMDDGAQGQVASAMSHCLLTLGGGETVPGDGQQDRPCPLNPAVGSGCTAVASLPGHAVIAAIETPNSVAHLVSTEAGADLLLAHALFRPPRA